jgi:prophage antirepressor-like protein
MDLTTILANHQNPWFWAAAIAGVLTLTSDKWLPKVKSLFQSKAAVTGPSEDADVTDVAGLHLLQARAKRSGCPKFVSAVREVELCFFNHAEPVEAVK